MSIKYLFSSSFFPNYAPFPIALQQYKGKIKQGYSLYLFPFIFNKLW